MYLSVILIDSVLRSGKNYYHQVFLEECEYVVKVKKMSEYITGNIEISSDDSDREDCDEENSHKENLMKDIRMKKMLMKKIKYRMYLTFIFL